MNVETILYIQWLLRNRCLLCGTHICATLYLFVNSEIKPLLAASGQVSRIKHITTVTEAQ